MVATYLDKLDPTLLSKEPFVQEGRKEGESKFERWYRLTVRSAYETKNYKKCVEMANQAMAMNIKWHYRNAYWIRIYRAKANLALGNYEECEHEYLALQSQFFDSDYYRTLYQIRLVRKSIVKRMSTCFMMFISADMIKTKNHFTTCF